MNKKILITLVIITIFAAVSFIVGATYSYFSDIEIIEGNSFEVESLE